MASYFDKSEYRNPKSETISKSKCQKPQTKADNSLPFGEFLYFELLSFEFVSYFVLRVSNFNRTNQDYFRLKKCIDKP